MKKYLSSILISCCLLALMSCTKKISTSEDCLPDIPVTRHVTNQHATVRGANSSFYIIEQGTIDTRLLPCNLDKEFQIDNLNVVISGEVKRTVRNTLEPCCTENFLITNISK